MALTLATVPAVASATNAAAGTTTGAWIDLRPYYEKSILALITNGGTGPTLPCTARLDLSPNSGGSPAYIGAGGSFAAGLVASTTYAAEFPLSGAAMFGRVVFVGNTGQAVTVQADVTGITTL